MQVNVEWVDARERLPESGAPVAAAVYGTYPPDFHDRPVAGEDYWLVMPMVFMTHHIAEDESHHHDCFVDSDGVVRHPPGGPSEEHVTHWAALPPLPRMPVHHVGGAEARTALRLAYETHGSGGAAR
ncbi:hypothetical protein GCM10010145_66490 [Streptomyces ruber]|uniref:Amine oxidase n=2 Tax=Streptomyces TaxID=1883 RepID=A0A918EXP7_9ACTN|nr:AQJ64_40280 family protein [Streptomyces ruber]GGQ87802.1 hypothetical protein GCM10010145_66490 [Streptomyces ruber]